MAKGRRKRGNTSRGTYGGDLYRDRINPSGEVRHVEHEDAGRLLCRRCGKDVRVVQIGRGWVRRNEDGSPHTRYNGSCSK